MGEMLTRGNRALLALLFRRFRNWDPADRAWLIDHRRANTEAKSGADQ